MSRPFGAIGSLKTGQTIKVVDGVGAFTYKVTKVHVVGIDLAWLDDFLYLPEVLYTLILVWLIFSGPGRYSVDGLIALRVGLFGVER